MFLIKYNGIKILVSFQKLITFGLSILFLQNLTCSQISDSIKIINLKQESIKAKQDTTRIRIWNDIASLYRKYDPDSSELYAKKAFQLSIKKNHLEGMASSCRHMGRLYYERYQYDSSLCYYKKSLGYFFSIDNKNMQCTLMNRIGITYGIQSQYDSALVYFIKCSKLAKQIGDDNVLNEAMHNLGIVHKHLGNWSKSLEYFETSKKLTERI